LGLDEVAASIELQAGEAHLAGSVLYFQHQPTAQAQPSKRRGDVKSTNLSDLMVHARQRDASADDVVAVRCDVLDWETARIGDGMGDLAALVLAFPTCKCTPALDRVTRRELVTRYVESHQRWAPQPLAPEALRAGVARAALAWVVDPDALVPQAQRAHGGRLAATLDTDWIWGARTARQRLVLRLGLYAEAAESVPAHAGPRPLALKLQQALARHWDIKTTSSPAP